MVFRGVDLKSRKHAVRKSRECKVVLSCRKCGYQWRPDPSKWRNNLSLDGDTHKMLKCPSCGTTNVIPAKWLKEIVA
jgi:Zn finger protein HypA/HybF involved in hydrogenase expression